MGFIVLSASTATCPDAARKYALASPIAAGMDSYQRPGMYLSTCLHMSAACCVTGVFRWCRGRLLEGTLTEYWVLENKVSGEVLSMSSWFTHAVYIYTVYKSVCVCVCVDT